MPLDYLSWLAVVLRYVDTQEGWYMPKGYENERLPKLKRIYTKAKG